MVDLILSFLLGVLSTVLFLSITFRKAEHQAFKDFWMY